ncbi:MAG TPA: hypothetical protein VGF67_13425 [Ktedonobacteraceae bacterium]|jgi:hypothetical protein
MEKLFKRRLFVWAMLSMQAAVLVPGVPPVLPAAAALVAKYVWQFGDGGC